MINFKKIVFWNFLSYGNYPTEVVLDRDKLTLIIGINGVGKSVFLDALLFALYGKPFRKKLNKPQLVNSITRKAMLVEVEFGIGGKQYMVRRGIRPNIFEIFCDGVIINQDSTNKDYQKYLEENILKINHRAFSQIVVLGSSNYTPFMDLSAQERRLIIEDLLDIQIFSVMNQLLKDRITTNKEELAEIETDLRVVKSKIEMSQEHAKQLQQNTEAMIQEKQRKIDELVVTNGKLTKDSENYIKTPELLETAKKSLSSHENKFIEMKRYLNVVFPKNINKLQKEIDFFKHTEACPTCSQAIDQATRDKHITEKVSKIADIKLAQQKTEEHEQTAKEEIDEWNTKVEEYTDQLETKRKLKTEWTINNNNINLLREEIKLLQNRNKEIVREHEDDNDLKIQDANLSKQKEQKINRREVYGIASTLLKDTGIKSHIIKQYIPVMNKYINKYLAAMDFYVQFEIDENFNERILSRHRDEFTYSSFSQGEKFRIDIALMFTWRAIAQLRSSISTNILVMDEILDGSLDNDGIEEFMKILSNLADESNVFIISHKQEQMIDKFDHVIRIAKKNGFSRHIS